jgi:thiol-disulfide isomerase/thioredoxin
MTKWLCLYVLLFAFFVQGEPLKLNNLRIGTTTYTNVTVLGSNATDLYFKHSQGFANVKLKYLTPQLQKLFNYDPKAAEDAERKQSENEILYQNTIARAAETQSPSAGPAKPKASLGSETGLADPISDRSLIGKPAPALQIDKWLGEKPSLEGKYVLISFWASWSTPCRQCIPELNALQKKYAEKLVVVGVTAESENDLAELAEPKLEFASGIDAKAKLTAAAGVSSIPQVLLTDPKGTVLYQGHPGALTEKKLQAILAQGPE